MKRSFLSVVLLRMSYLVCQKMLQTGQKGKSIHTYAGHLKHLRMSFVWLYSVVAIKWFILLKSLPLDLGSHFRRLLGERASLLRR